MPTEIYPLEIKCFVCNRTARAIARPEDRRLNSVQCNYCGNYIIPWTAQVTARSTSSDEIYILSSAIRYNSERGRLVRIELDNEAEIIASFPRPRNIFEQVDLCLDYLALPAYAFIGAPIYGNVTYSTWFAAKEESEFEYLCDLLSELGYCGEGGPDKQLKARGWDRVLSLREGRIESAQIFVAMWFDPQMNDAWTVGIEKPLENLKFKPLRIDRKEHNDMIDDQIIAEIRASNAVVADFTGDRAGVYFEAGFARGLGKPVIWTCRKDWESKLHFDTRQFNHIIWSDPEDLALKLTNRVRATLPLPQKT
jgi:hypothetical protein